MDWKNRRRKMAFVFLMSCLLCTGLTSVRSEAKTDSAESAAQKVAEAWEKACSTKSVRKVTVSLSSSRKKLWKNTMAFQDEVNRAIYDNAYLPLEEKHATEFMTLRFDKLKNNREKSKDIVTGVVVTKSYSKGKVTYRFVIDGADKKIKKTYKEINANKYCAREIQDATRDMDQYDRAWYVNLWVLGHSHFEGDFTPGWLALKKKTAHGLCYDIAYFYEIAADYAGLEHYGRVTNYGHTWNVVKIDGTIYHIDVDRSTFLCSFYYDNMAGLLDFLRSDVERTETRRAEQAFSNVQEENGPSVSIQLGYDRELFEEVQKIRQSMTPEEWDSKIAAFWGSEYCSYIITVSGLKREDLFAEPWECGFARFGLQTQKQVKSDNIFSLNESGKPKKWQYTWIR